jgi:pilus assembly protein Flp/PilA
MKRLSNRILQQRWGKKGQSTAEYIIIVALVAIGSIALITVFGNQVRALFSASAQQLSGKDTATVTDHSGTATTQEKTTINQF